MSRPARRCALYTRKSSEEGLDQEFNSLDAQREACAAYVKSQTGEGWRALAERYDDGGYSGGSMERPALARLLRDVEAGRVDVVVVYKIDRLTRSLPDFARIIEIFDRHAVSFVSVTQAFNTTTSMGRLTLNVLLSFAQFEREVTGERIRDKIAASKAKGMWMGGTVPLGYDPPAAGSHRLIVNPAEAETVRLIFRRYLVLGSVHALQRWLDQQGIRSKQRITQRGRQIGGQPFSRGALFALLRNRLYRGMIVHKGTAHPGQHDAIIEAPLFEAVQQGLDQGRRRGADISPTHAQAPLLGRIVDDQGRPFTPTTSYGKGGRAYRYYVTASLQCGGKPMGGDTVERLSARTLEHGLATVMRRLLPEEANDPLAPIIRVEIHQQDLHVLLPIERLVVMRRRLTERETLEADPAAPELARLIVPLVRRRGQSWAIAGDQPEPRPDPTLIRALKAAHAMLEHDTGGLPRLDSAPTSPYRRKLVRLAFLAPAIQRAILTGRQPPTLTLARLLEMPIPLDWSGQEAALGIPLH